MTWRDTIFNLIKDALLEDAEANNASDESKAQLISMASDLADGIANSVHDDLISGLDSQLASFTPVLNALNSLMGALASEPQLTTSKPLATAVGGTIPGLTAAITSLRDKIASFQ